MRPKDILRLLRLFKGLFGSYKRSIAILVALGLVGGFLESVGISILVPLFSHILDKPLSEADTITRFFGWFFEVLSFEPKLRFLLPFIGLIFLARAVVLYVFEWVRASISYDYERTQRSDLYRAVLDAPWRYHISQKVGFVENTVMIDIERTTKLLQDLTNGILQGSSLLVYVGIALLLEPYIATFTLIAGGVLLFVFKPLLRRTRQYARETLEVTKSIAHDINETVVGLKTIKALGAEQGLREHAVKLFEVLRTLKLKQTLLKAGATIAVQPASVLFVLVAFSIAFAQPDFNFALFVVTIFLIQRIFLYVDRIQSILHSLSGNLPYADHVVKLQRELRAVHERGSEGRPFSFSRDLVFSNVSFAYDDAREILQDVSFKVERGEMLAVVGASGAGKTTVADLALRLLTPTSGEILLDGVSIRDISQTDWHKKTGYVAQDIFLMNDSILNNIRFYDSRVTDEDIEYALSAAHLKPLIEKLPNGVETLVGERGLELSGGERQRVALARVLARRPELLVLDEATSALDKNSSVVIEEALTELRGKITMLVIAHRFDTIKSADKMMVLEDGCQVEFGEPHELLKNKDSHFSKLHG